MIYHPVTFHTGAFPGVNPKALAHEIVSFLNYVFRKTTQRQFRTIGVYGNETEMPSSVTGVVGYDEEFEIEIYLLPGPAQFGSLSAHAYGIVQARWYDVTDKRFLNPIVHEVGHLFGVANGEYYKHWLLTDFTGVEPELKVSAVNTADHYWHRTDKLEWLSDPMLAPDPKKPRFCWLSSHIINSGKYRKPPGPLVPDMHAIPLWIEPKVARVMVWNARGQQQVTQDITDGRLILDWGCGQDEAHSADGFRFIKVYQLAKPAYAFGFGLSIFDVVEAVCRQGEGYSVKVFTTLA